MQKMSKTAQNWKKSDRLEKELKEDEKELEAIKQALEKNNMKALNNLPIKNIPKSRRLSAKVPKKLSDKEKERRDEIRRLKEVEDLDKIQKQLFKQVKKRRKMEPIDKKILSTNQRFVNIDKDDIFALNLNKECDRILGNQNSKQYMANKTTSAVWRKKENSVKRKTSNKKVNKNIEKKNMGYPLSAINRKNINVDKIKENININDEEKDQEFLQNLQSELKTFYMEKEKEIFDFLNEIHLCRYIGCFLSEGYDIFEEFIELPKDFFEKMEKPFLSKEQQEKLYNKLSIFKTKKDEEKTKNKNENNFNKNNLFSKTQPEFNQKIKNKNTTNNNKENNKNKEIIINGTLPIIIHDELNENSEIAELERKNAEEFKKAVNEWRKNNTNNNASNNTNEINQSSVDTQKKINKESNAPVNDSSLLVNSPDEIICCWNCFKPIKKEKSVQKDYENQFDHSILFKNKNFCCSKCMKDYEKKKRATLACFQCNHIFDLYQGFVAYQGEKFCCTKCKEKFIETEKLIKKNNTKKKEKIIEIKEKNNKDDYYEGDDYDPMEDF